MKQSKSDLNEKNRIFFDRWAGSYDHFIFGWWMRYAQRKVFESVVINKNQSVLDIGCGTGEMLLLLSQRVPTGKIVGIDISSNMLAEAGKKVGSIGNVTLLQAEAGKIPFADGSFDHIFSTEAFHHFPDPMKALEEMGRVLKKKGTIVIADINFPPLFITNRLFKVEPGFVKMYTPKEFDEMARKSNLVMISTKRRGIFGLVSVFKRNG